MPVVDPDVQTRSDRRRPVDGPRWPAPPGLPPRLGDDGKWWPDPQPGSPLSNARLGMWMLLAAEAVFFGGFVGAFLMLRVGADSWPPPLQPRLPVGVTGANTLILLLSSCALARAVQVCRRADHGRLLAWLGRTAALGALFLAVQGLEWIRLIRFGLTVSSGAYGAAFYTLVGVHGVHVLGALIWLVLVLATVTRGEPSRDYERLVLCAMYWHFVVAVWPILYVLVYLA